ncbi:MAG: ImmA/IrrE family metallo-endopeptidase, partial [Streptococcus orisratti]|nr:ImmA/IrrE family metallo-endopeptidase [Streptococcus orisratti]
RRREQYELQADRNMIHYLVKEELALMDDVRDFNYVRFMEKYDLKTTVNETMVIEEFNNLVN